MFICSCTVPFLTLVSNSSSCFKKPLFGSTTCLYLDKNLVTTCIVIWFFYSCEIISSSVIVRTLYKIYINTSVADLDLPIWQWTNTLLLVVLSDNAFEIKSNKSCIGIFDFLTCVPLEWSTVHICKLYCKSLLLFALVLGPLNACSRKQ